MMRSAGAAMPPLVGSFLGLTLQRRRLGGTTASDNLYRPLSHLPAHLHERPFVAFVLGGCFQETCGSESVDCAAGTTIFHPAREVHANTFTPRGGRVFSVELATEWEGERGHEPPPRQVIQGGRVFQLGLGLRLRLVSDDGLADFHVEEFAQALGAEL